MDKLFTIFYYTLALMALGFGALLVLMQTDILPKYDVRIVQSGSMEPAISTGSVVIIEARERYRVGDVVTFGGDDARGQIPTTHRIIEDRLQEGELVFITQGDANDAPDMNPTRPSDIRGAVIFTVPYLGYLLDFARQPLGFALLIGIPAAFIVIEESSNIYRALRGRPEEDEEESVDSSTHIASDDPRDEDSSAPDIDTESETEQDPNDESPNAATTRTDASEVKDEEDTLKS